MNNAAEPETAISGDTLFSQSTPVFGHLDVVRDLMLSGWVVNPYHPEKLVGLSINDVIATVLPADQPRPDVFKAGLGDRKCGFTLFLPKATFGTGTYLIKVFEPRFGRILTNGTVLLRDGQAVPETVSDLSTLSVQNFIDIYSSIGAYKEIEGLAERLAAKFAHLPPAQVIAVLYCLVLNRHPDPEGFRFKMNTVKHNFYDYRQLAIDLLQSDEFTTRHHLRTVRERLEKITLPAMMSS